MRLRSMVAIFTVLIFILSSPSIAYSNNDPKLWADSAVLIDMKTGQVLYQKNAFKLRHPASLTKIMTGILALENGHLNDIVTVSKRAANVNIGQTIKLRAGQKLRLEDLVYAALMHSANDAAVAIAEHVGGSEEIFLKMMNQKAMALGARNTHFVNANGYSKPNHKTTAYDLALISRYAMTNSKFVEIVNTRVKTITKIGDDTIEIKNTNRLLKTYPGCFGLKTGTTSLAGGCLAAAATKQDKKLIAIILKSGDKRRYQDCINLFDYGFEQITDYHLYKKNEVWEELYLSEGKPQRLKVLIEKDINLTVPKDQVKGLEKRLYLNRKPQLPLQKGEKIGEIKLYLSTQEVLTVNLIAGNEVVKRTFWNSLLP